MVPVVDNLEVRIDPEFAALLPALAEEEAAQLEGNLLAEGRARETLTAWLGTDPATLLDGHNRHRLCAKHGLPYRVRLLDFPDRRAAMLWMLTDQLGKRTLTPQQSSYLRGKLYQLEKAAPGKNLPKNDATPPPQNGTSAVGDSLKGQNVPLDQNNGKTHDSAAEGVAARFGVTDRTVKRDSQYTEALDSIAQAHGEHLRDALLAKKAPKKEVIAAAALPETKQRKALDALLRDRGQPPASEPDQAVEAAPSPSDTPCDPDGTAIPSQARAAFDGLPTLRKWLSRLDELARDLEALGQSPAGTWVLWQSAQSQLKAARRTVHTGRPAFVCNACAGGPSDCELCKGRGFVTEAAYRRHREALKAGGAP